MNGLDRIGEAAGRDRNLRFNNLMHHVTPELLAAGYHALKSNAAAGIDDMTWHEYGQRASPKRLTSLGSRIYAAGPGRTSVSQYVPRQPPTRAFEQRSKK